MAGATLAEWRNRQVGSYVLVDRIGQGGMGVVYRARDTMLDRDVALKMMQPPGEQTTRAEIAARFFVEAKAAARIQSRHVAQVLQLGETDDGEVFIAMELLVGEALSSVIQQAGRLEPARGVRIGRQIARGMQAAHVLGVVHRDLKPANVMLVTADGEHDVVKILDFGVAKLTRDEDQKNLTQTGMLLGTLPYMAPEQIFGKTVDARTDIYSLGIVLFRMLAGAPMFDAENLSDIVRNQVETPAPRFAERVPGLVVPAAIERVVLRCLEKDPANRFQSMADVDAALGRALEDHGDAPAAATVVSRARREETLPTGTRLPPAAATALLAVSDHLGEHLGEHVGEHTRSALVSTAEGAPAYEPALTFEDAPVTEPDARPSKGRGLLPIAAAIAVVLALMTLAVAAVLVLSLEPAPADALTTPTPVPALPPAPAPEVAPPLATPAPTQAIATPEPPGQVADPPRPPSTPPAEPAVSPPAPVPASAKPAAAKAAAAKPALTKPATPKPATPKPATPKPATPKPATAKPAPTNPAPTNPATPTEEKPADPGFTRVLTKEGG